MEAAHNPEVRGSKPRSAIFVLLQSEASILIYQSKMIRLRKKYLFALGKTSVWLFLMQTFFCFIGHRLYLNWWFLKEPLFVLLRKYYSFSLFCNH